MSALVLAVILFLPQDSRPASGPEPLAAFAQLPTLKKAGVLRRIEKRCQASDDPLLRSILALRTTGPELPVRLPTGCHLAEDWAKGVAPTRTLVAADSAAHQAVRAKYPRVPFLDDLSPSVSYDWHVGRVVREERSVGYDERFTNLLAGWPPDADLVIAQLVARFDQDPAQRRLAEYFEHWWADLDAKAYEGVSLHEAWSSGRIVDVPDVDAIPFAVHVLGDRSFVSPIPADARRTALYEKIRAAAAAHRRYRSVVLAAAAAAVRAEPVLDPTWKELVPRFHLVWAECAGDVAAVTKRVAEAVRDRDAFVAETDARVVATPAVYELREGRKRDLARVQQTITRIANEELAAER